MKIRSSVLAWHRIRTILTSNMKAVMRFIDGSEFIMTRMAVLDITVSIPAKRKTIDIFKTCFEFRAKFG
jgi:hypothetical protein